MRYTVIDGIAVIVDRCGDCPFFSTEFELSAECRYPHQRHDVDKWGDEIDKDCPLKEERYEDVGNAV